MIIENKHIFVKKIRITFFIFLFSLLFTATPTLAGYYGLEKTAGSAGVTKGIVGEGNVQSFIGSVVGTALSLISIIFFLFMLYGGFLWMTARGSSEQTKKAQDTIIAAVIGIVVVLGAYALTTFVFNSLSGGASTSQGQKSLGGACTASYDCVSGLVCGPNNTCITQEDFLGSGVECIQNEDCMGDMVCLQGRCGIDPMLGTLRLAQDRTCPKFDQMSNCVISVGENNNAVNVDSILNQLDSLMGDCYSVDSVEGLDIVYTRAKDLLTQNELGECIK